MIFETLVGHGFTISRASENGSVQASLDLQVAHWPLSSWWSVGKIVPFPHCHFSLRKSKVQLPISLQQLIYNERPLGSDMLSSTPFSLYFKHCFLPHCKGALLTDCRLSSSGGNGWLIFLYPLHLDNGGSTMAAYWKFSKKTDA